MPLIIPSADLRNNYNKISKRCHETKEPIYVTRNGVNDLVVLSDEVFEKMRKQNEESEEVRVEVDDRAEKIGYKIREAQLQKVPYMLVVGDKEQEAGEVGVRNRKDGDVGAMKLEDFVEKIDEEIKTFAK